MRSSCAARYQAGWASAVIALAAGCANVESPPGSGPDASPPAVVERYPAPNAVVPDLDDDAWLRFDEPLQSPRNLERGLDLSPAWEWKFSPRRNGFSVRPREGWRPGVVYHVRVPRGVSDLLRNSTRATIEWTFSTGPEITSTRIDGTIYTRLQGTRTRDARILFLPPDSVPYSVVSDTGGVFSMHSLPPGEYSVFAFMDQNRNRRLDREMEPYDSAFVSLPDPQSRHALDLWMVPPDSTPPVLVGAVAYDTVTLVLEFDEPLDPEAPLDSVRINLAPVSGGPGLGIAGLRVGQPEAPAAVPLERLLDPGQPEDSVQAPEPGVRADSLDLPEVVEEVDSLAAVADTSRAPGDSVPRQDSLRAAGREPGGRVRTELESAGGRELPFPTLVVTLEQPLTEDTFRVAVTGARNLRGLAGGGDTTFVYVAPLAPVVSPDADGEPVQPAEPSQSGDEPVSPPPQDENEP